MKHIVNEVNIFDNAILTTYEFDTAADAMEYAMTMNEIMEATPIRYKYMNNRKE